MSTQIKSEAELQIESQINHLTGMLSTPAIMMNPAALASIQTNINQLQDYLDKVQKLPDWLSPTLKEDKNKFALSRLKLSISLGNTEALEKRIIDKYNLTKYAGILMEDSQQITEKIEQKTFKFMRDECKLSGHILETKTAKEVAMRVESVVHSPVDNRSLISFKNKTLDWKATHKTGDLVWLPERVENHNAIKWDVLSKNDIKNSPKHMEQIKWMNKLFKDWRIPSDIVFKIGAYTMCKENFADKIFFFEGRGGEGKSQVLKFIIKMYEDSACKIYDPINPTLGSEMAFVGTQVVYNDDIDDGKLALKHIKPVATGGDIDVRPLYQPNRTYSPYSTMIFNTNYTLKTGNDAVSKALESRVYVLKFTGPDMRGTPEAQEYKKRRPTENKYFMEAFVYMCVSAIPKLIEEEFTDVLSKETNKKDAISANNTVKMFIDEFDVDEAIWDPKIRENVPLFVSNGKTTIMALYSHYQNWVKAGGFYEGINKSVFSQQFKELTNVETTVKPSSIGGQTKRWIDISGLIEAKAKAQAEEMADV